MNSGAQAEAAAARYLQQRGLQLLTRNYRSRFGEIDLILQDRETLVFVEVRMRSGNAFGGAAASVDAHKQSKLVRTAQHYLATLAHIPPCRFDVVLLSSPDAIQWVKNAFEA
jgi:putative endonuclease